MGSDRRARPAWRRHLSRAGWTIVAGLALAAAWGWLAGVRLRLYRIPAEIEIVDLGGEAPAKLEGPGPAAETPDAAGTAGEAAAPAVRNVIVVYADGLGLSHLVAARNRLVGLNGRLFVERFPVASWTTVHSAGTAYVDSASSASALATGLKTQPRWLSMTPDGVPRRTILEAAMARGMAAGLVTSTDIFDASPAALVSHVRERDELAEVARQMARSGVDLLVSEAPPPEEADEEAVPGAAPTPLEAALAPFDAAGYRRYDDWGALSSDPPAAGTPLLALLPPGAIAERRSPSLTEIARFALARLSASEEGFFLFVEDEETDSGSHRNELDRVIRAVDDLEGVARAAVEFGRRDGRTLVLFLSDHETGALALFGGREGEPLRYRWGSYGHTVGPVPLLAWGAGAERFAGVLDNTEVPRILAGLLGLEPAPGFGGAVATTDPGEADPAAAPPN